MKDPIHEACEKLSRERHEIIDLFCKTFLLCQQPKSMDDLRDLFENYSLEMKLISGMNMHWEYSLKLMDK